MDPQEIARQLRKPEGEAGIEMGKFMNKSNGPMNRLVFKHTAVQDGESILEVGFGNGHLVKDLIGSAREVKYYGIDYSPEMVAEAKKHNQDLIQQNICEFREGDFADLPYQDSSFDKICSINTLYFLEDPKQALNECRRILKPAGKLYLGIRPRHIVENWQFTRFGFTLYEPKEVEIMLQECGFRETGYVLQDENPVIFEGKELPMKSSCVFGKI